MTIMEGKFLYFCRRTAAIFILLLCVTARAQEIPAMEPQSDSLRTEQPASEPVAALWDRANTAYINGDYRAAIGVYRSILDRGVSSAALYYNLGNAYFKEEEIGQAILSYHRALRLAPGSDDIRYNLEVAHALTKDDIDRVPEFFLKTWVRDLRHTMGCTAWSIVSLVMLAAALGLGLLFLLARRLPLRKAGFYGSLGAALLFVVATLFAAAEYRELLDRDEAVVMVGSSAVKSSPDNSATDLFILHEGTTLRITDRLDEWCEIVIADGKKGWIEARKIEII